MYNLFSIVKRNNNNFSLSSCFAINRYYVSTLLPNFRKKRNKGKDYSLIINTLGLLDSPLSVNGFVANEKTQKFLEGFLYNEFSSNAVVKPNYVASVNTALLGDTMGKYINSKTSMLNTYIGSLLKVTKQEAAKFNAKKDAYMNH